VVIVEDRAPPLVVVGVILAGSNGSCGRGSWQDAA
jgi:hypothetical protein